MLDLEERKRTSRVLLEQGERKDSTAYIYRRNSLITWKIEAANSIFILKMDKKTWLIAILLISTHLDNACTYTKS